MTPLQRLKSEFFSRQKVIQYKPGIEGQRIEEDGTILIGNRAGPELATSNLCHEMAHFVEIEENRMACWRWGLKVPEVYIMGICCVEPTTRQITDREIRVSAYQANLHEYVGLRIPLRKYTDALEHLPDWVFVPLEDGRPAYGDGAPEDEELSYNEKHQSRLRWIANRVQELRSVYTIERFVSEWNRRTALLADRKGDVKIE